MWVLEVELTEESTQVHVPDEIVVDREVTNEPAFKNAEIARGVPLSRA
jgi:CYTH domain-containing protein